MAILPSHYFDDFLGNSSVCNSGLRLWQFRYLLACARRTSLPCGLSAMQALVRRQCFEKRSKLILTLALQTLRATLETRQPIRLFVDEPEQCHVLGRAVRVNPHVCRILSGAMPPLQRRVSAPGFSRQAEIGHCEHFALVVAFCNVLGVFFFWNRQQRICS